MATAVSEKLCPVCGRRFAWRKKWARCWDTVRYCSQRCRRRRRTGTDAKLEHAILSLLDARRTGATICPSEAARQVAPEDWRALMDDTRAAARRLCAQGAVRILARGQVVDPTMARGPIRLQRVPRA